MVVDRQPCFPLSLLSSGSESGYLAVWPGAGLAGPGTVPEAVRMLCSVDYEHSQPAEHWDLQLSAEEPVVVAAVSRLRAEKCSSGSLLCAAVAPAVVAQHVVVTAVQVAAGSVAPSGEEQQEKHSWQRLTPNHLDL